MCLEEVVKAFVRMLELHDPTSKEHSQRVAMAAEFVAIQMSMTFSEISDIKMAAWLHDIGKISIPQQLLQKDPRQLSVTEKTLMNEHPVLTEGMLRKIKGLENVCKIIRHQNEKYDGTGWPDKLSRETIPIGSLIIAVTNMYDSILFLASVSSIEARKDFALTYLRNSAGNLYDPEVVSIFIEFLDVKTMVDSEIKEVPVPLNNLKTGMVLSKDLLTHEKLVVLAKDISITERELEKLARLSGMSQIVEPAYIYVE